MPAAASPGRYLAAILAVAAVLFLSAIPHDFVMVDDSAYVLRNPEVPSLDILKTLSPSTLTEYDWTPVVTLSHAIEYRVFGFNAYGFHAVNVLLHLLTVGAVFVLAMKLGFAHREALLACLITAVHPLQVETVAWISARKDLLSLLFGLGFILAFRSGRSVYAILLLMLALGSKGTAVAFPAAACVLYLLDPSGGRGRRGVLAVALVLAAARTFLSMAAQHEVIQARFIGHLTFLERMSVMGRVLAAEIAQYALPFDIAAAYSWSPASWSEPAVWSSWILVGIFAAALATAAYRDRPALFSFGFLVAALVPVMNFVPAPLFQADRYLHAPLAAAALLTARFAGMLSCRRPLLPSIATAWCLLVFVPLSALRIPVWRNDETLWLDTASLPFPYPFAWRQLASYYLRTGDSAAAEHAFRKVFELDGASVDSTFNLALYLSRAGKIDDALAVLDRGIARTPGDEGLLRLRDKLAPPAPVAG